MREIFPLPHTPPRITGPALSAIPRLPAPHRALSAIRAKNRRLLYNSVLPLNLESEKTICAAY
ncbi:hypothetical protein NEILACOT_03584 [Neisseria lactamica ATCC 23970]|uniref:Uncharacterized protein n=1 Tax=Neisseria lactamica ATCC 23970 TaxID=546265 RepID=D0W7T3_NEILA|nr:hypothetical protein NEILACOT_03584 [Neisseria lactamica ATCC 23970]